MNITINEKLNTTLTNLAKAHQITEVQYVEHIINKHLLARYKEDFIREVSIDTLPRYKTAFDSVKAEITAENLAVREALKLDEELIDL